LNPEDFSDDEENGLRFSDILDIAEEIPEDLLLPTTGSPSQTRPPSSQEPIRAVFSNSNSPAFELSLDEIEDFLNRDHEINNNGV